MAVRTPEGLDKGGRKLWRAIAGKDSGYDLRPDELRTLEDACRLADTIDKLQLELDKQDLTVKGSMGQPVPNGHLTELRQYRATLSRLLSSLKLPDAGGDGQRSASEQARAAATARWSKRRGA